MELLLAVVASFVLEAVKWLTKKLGKEATKGMIILLLFGASLGFVIVTESNLVSLEAVSKFIELLLMAIGTYEALIKRLGPFLFGKVKLAKAKILK